MMLLPDCIKNDTTGEPAIEDMYRPVVSISKKYHADALSVGGIRRIISRKKTMRPRNVVAKASRKRNRGK